MKKYILIFLFAFPSIVSHAQAIVTDSVTTDLGDFILETSENEELAGQDLYGDSTTTSDGGNAQYLVGETNNERVMRPQMNEAPIASNMSIFPNPSSGITEIKLYNLRGIVDIILFDPVGRIVYENNIVSQGDRSIFLDIAKYDSGIYYLQAVSDSNKLIKELIKN